MARHRNVRGQEFAFVRYVKVKNKDKLDQALNNVWFGDWRVWACEARYDRFAHVEGETRVANVVGKKEGGKDSAVIVVKSEGINNVRITKQKEVVQSGGAVSLRVGDVDVPVGGQERGAKVRKVDVVEKYAGGKVMAEVSISTAPVGEGKSMAGHSKAVHREMKSKEAVQSVMGKVQEQQRTQYILVFHSRSQDLKWAHSGLVATVSVEESALAIQQKVEDAGFPNVVITPMGGIVCFFIVMKVMICGQFSMTLFISLECFLVQLESGRRRRFCMNVELGCVFMEFLFMLGRKIFSGYVSWIQVDLYVLMNARSIRRGSILHVFLFRHHI